VADIITDGWLELDDGTDFLKVTCERISWDYVIKGKIKHYDVGINLNIPVNKQYLIFMAEGIWLNTHTKLSNFIDYLKDWQLAGSFNLRIRRDTAVNYIECDGDNTTFVVNLKDKMEGISKESPGDQQYYKINKLIFEQTG
jgi:hypothetical protein